MLQVRNKRVTAGLYLSECMETPGQLYQHISLLSLCCTDPSCAQEFSQRDAFAFTSQHPSTVTTRWLDFKIHWWTDDAHRCQVCFNQCQTLMCGQDHCTRSVYLPATFHTEGSSSRNPSVSRYLWEYINDDIWTGWLISSKFTSPGWEKLQKMMQWNSYEL